jgi:hypothetical protein
MKRPVEPIRTPAFNQTVRLKLDTTTSTCCQSVNALTTNERLMTNAVADSRFAIADSRFNQQSAI